MSERKIANMKIGIVIFAVLAFSRRSLAQYNYPSPQNALGPGSIPSGVNDLSGAIATSSLRPSSLATGTAAPFSQQSGGYGRGQPAISTTPSLFYGKSGSAFPEQDPAALQAQQQFGNQQIFGPRGPLDQSAFIPQTSTLQSIPSRVSDGPLGVPSSAQPPLGNALLNKQNNFGDGRLLGNVGGNRFLSTPAGILKPEVGSLGGRANGNLFEQPQNGITSENDGSYQNGDYSAIPGSPDVDYPVLSSIPKTAFDCKQQQLPGYYADVFARCQVFHICALNTSFDFLCPNGTIFSQQHLVCVWWNQFDCDSAPSLYGNNANIYDYSQTGGESFRDGAGGGQSFPADVNDRSKQFLSRPGSNRPQANFGDIQGISSDYTGPGNVNGNFGLPAAGYPGSGIPARVQHGGAGLAGQGHFGSLSTPTQFGGRDTISSTIPTSLGNQKIGGIGSQPGAGPYGQQIGILSTPASVPGYGTPPGFVPTSTTIRQNTIQSLSREYLPAQ